MISDELKQYIDVQIKEALKSKPLAGLPLDSGLEPRLSEVELWLATTILLLQELRPEFDWKKRSSEMYNRLQKKLSRRRAQGVSAAFAELEYC